MSVKLQAFVGVESYDLIHFTSRVLLALGQRVLLVDCSNDKSLYFSVQEANNNSITDIRGVHFIMEPLLSKDILRDYDWVIGYFGWNISSKKLPAFEKVCIVTDLQIHNIERCKRINKSGKSNYVLVARDCPGNRFKGRIVRDELQSLCNSEFYELTYDSIDYGYKLGAGYDNKMRFDKCTKGVSDLIAGLLSDEWDDKTIYKYVKYAGRGN